MRALVTGSSGLVGSACVKLLEKSGFDVLKIDNGMRGKFFPESKIKYESWRIDICDQAAIDRLIRISKPTLIVHCAAQPSHDLAARIPFLDFETNAVGTLNLLEAARQHCPDTPFIFMSTNKVYGDRPNGYLMGETETRFTLASHPEGVSESCSIDQSKHSLFGASKLAADILVQEYGRYFGMPTVCLRAGCLTGAQHAGVELHGFLNYLMRCNLSGKQYTVYGYKGKQVRDNLHADDVARFALTFFKSPKTAAVYNIGGGKENSCSILEAFEMAENATGKPMYWKYVDEPRSGDHICYYSDLGKINADYPDWTVTRDLPSIFAEMAAM